LVPDEIVTAVVSTIAHFDFILCSCSIFICWKAWHASIFFLSCRWWQLGCLAKMLSKKGGFLMVTLGVWLKLRV
jgi:hypothetical protein